MATFFFHSSSEALVEPAEAALIPLVFVDDTLTTEPDRLGEKRSAHLGYMNLFKSNMNSPQECDLRDCILPLLTVEVKNMSEARGLEGEGRRLPAGVDVTLPDASTEKALAAVTAGGAVVLARGLVPADGTVGDHAIILRADAGLCWHAVCRSNSKTTRRYHSNWHTNLSTSGLGVKMQHVCFALIMKSLVTSLIFIPSEDTTGNTRSQVAKDD